MAIAFQEVPRKGYLWQIKCALLLHTVGQKSFAMNPTTIDKLHLTKKLSLPKPDSKKGTVKPYHLFDERYIETTFPHGDPHRVRKYEPATVCRHWRDVILNIHIWSLSG